VRQLAALPASCLVAREAVWRADCSAASSEPPSDPTRPRSAYCCS